MTTDERLAEIRERWESHDNGFTFAPSDRRILLTEDVPWLLAEVGRLKRRLAAMTPGFHDVSDLYE